MEWYIKCLRQYADFNGRARRKEYFMFLIYNGLVLLIISIFEGMISLFFDVYINVFGFIWYIATIIPSTALIVRRLHDTNRSGWYFFWVLIPFVGIIMVTVAILEDSYYGSNRHGKDPKERQRKLYNIRREKFLNQKPLEEVNIIEKAPIIIIDKENHSRFMPK